MVVDRTKKLKVAENSEDVDAELVLSVEKLQEIQDELEKVSPSSYPLFSTLYLIICQILKEIHWIDAFNFRSKL